MKPTPISTVAAMRAGTVLEMIAGEFTRIFSDRKSGDNSHGEWSMQNATFKDDNGDTIKVQFKNRELVPASWEGRRVEITTVGDKKAKGISVDEYQGVKRLVLYPTVEFAWIDNSGRREESRGDGRYDDYEQTRDHGRSRESRPQDTGRRSDPPREETRRQDPPRQERSAAEERGEAGYRDAREALARMALGYQMAHDASAAIAWAEYHRHGLITPSAAIGARANTMFIELCKGGHVRALPVMDIAARPLKGKPVQALCELLSEKCVDMEAAKAVAVRNATAERPAPSTVDPDRPETFHNPPARREFPGVPPDGDEIPF